MELKLLKIKNIGAVDSAVVDFEALPADKVLAFASREENSGVGVIHDAVCLACYGMTPSLRERVLQREANGVGETLTSQDVRRLVRQGAREASAELLFLNAAGEEVAASWSCVLDKDGCIDKLLHTVKTAKDGVLEGPAARECLVRETGTDYAGYCRMSLLPYAEMMRWLKADSAQRAAILERLTHSDRYASVGSMVSTLYNEKKEAYEHCEMQMETYRLLNDDERRVLTQEFELNKTQADQIEAQYRATYEKSQWREHDQQLKKELEAVESRLASLKEYRESRNYTAEESFLKVWHESVDARLAWKEMERQQEERELLNNCEQEYRRKYQTLVGGSLYMEDSVRRHLLAIDQMRQEQQVDSAYETVYRNVSALPHLCAMLLANTDLIESLGASRGEITNRLPLLSAEADACRKRLNQYEDQLKRQQQTVQAAQMQYESLNPSTLVDEERDLSMWRLHLQEAEAAVRRMDDAITQHQIAEEEKNELEKSIKALETECYELGVKSHEYGKVYEEARRLFDSTCRNVGDEAKAIRARLHNGDICPVCGTRIDNIVRDEDLMRTFAPYECDLAEKERQWKRCEQQHEAICNTLQMYRQSEMPKRRSACDRSEETMRTCFGKAAERCTLLNIVLNEPTAAFAGHALNQIDEQKHTVETRMEDFYERRRMVALAQKRCDDSVLELTRITDGLGETKEALAKISLRHDHLQHELQRTDDMLAEARRNEEQYRKRFDDMFGNDFWYAEWRKDTAGFADYWRSRAGKNSARREQLSKLEEELGYMLTRQDECARERMAVERNFPHWVGASAAAAEEIPSLASDWIDLCLNAERLASDICNSDRLHESLQKRMQMFSSQYPSVNLELLVQQSQQDFEAISAQHKQCEEQWLQTLGAAGIVRRRIEEHNAVKPVNLVSSETSEKLHAELDELKERQAVLYTECGKRRGLLLVDDRNHMLAEDVKKQLERAKNEFDKWAVLYNLVGVNNGEVFRDIAQSYILDGLLVDANAFLRGAGVPCQLVLKRGSMQLSAIIDGRQMAVEQLPAAVAGMVAMALSAAVASVADKKVDTIFVDQNGVRNATDMNPIIAALSRYSGCRIAISDCADSGMAVRIPVGKK